MVSSVAKEASLYKLNEDQLYDAKLVKVEELSNPFIYKKGPNIGQPGVLVKWEWSFEITSGEHKGLIIKGTTEPELNMLLVQKDLFRPVRPWLEGLTGKEVTVGMPFESDPLIEMPCRITVKHDDPRPRKNGEGFWYDETVLDVLPPSGTVTAMAQESGTVPF